MAVPARWPPRHRMREIFLRVLNRFPNPFLDHGTRILLRPPFPKPFQAYGTRHRRVQQTWTLERSHPPPSTRSQKASRRDMSNGESLPQSLLGSRKDSAVNKRQEKSTEVNNQESGGSSGSQPSDDPPFHSPGPV